jgi:hypothetical protein
VSSVPERCQYKHFFPFFCSIDFFFILYLQSYTYWFTPWSRVLLEKLTGVQLVKKFPEFYGTRRFITACTSVRRMSLSWATSIHSIHPHPTSWKSILILSSNLLLGLPSGKISIFNF